MMPSFINFDGYVTGYNKIQEVEDVLMYKFLLNSDKSREYDPQGYIRTVNARYAHQINIGDYIIRNHDNLHKAYQRLRKWNILNKIEIQM